MTAPISTTQPRGEFCRNPGAAKPALAAWAFIAGAGCAAQPVVVADPELHARTRLQKMVDRQELPGAQYMVVTADRTLVELSVGVDDVESRRQMQPETILMAYSITKALTSIAVLQLAQRGQLDLDAPLSRYFAAHPYGRDVTIRMLLAHTAGIPNPLPLGWFSPMHEPFDRQAALAGLLDDHKRAAAPGEAYRYTNLGYWLLEQVVEAASGQDYGRYTEQHLFEPLGIAKAAASFAPREDSPLAVGHQRRWSFKGMALRAMTPAKYWGSPSNGWSRAAALVPHGRAYGGLFTNSRSLARVLQDLMREESRLLSQEMRAEMFAEQHTRDGKGVAATLGWIIGELDGVRYFGKQGGGLGFHGNVRIYPSLGIASVLLANSTEISAGPIDSRSDLLDLGFVRSAHGAPSTRSSLGQSGTPTR